jgi:2'-5' RNA ligase
VAAQRRDTPPSAPQRGHDRTVVLCAAFDAVADAAIDRLRDQVEAAGHPTRRTHRPHFTLSAARLADADEAVAVAAEVAARHAPIPLTMAAFGSFASGVLFVAPDESVALRALHRDVHETMRGHWAPAFGPQSAPDRWIAHCTLATRLSRSELRTLRRSPFEPFRATVDALAVIVVGDRGDLAHIPLAAERTEER